MNKFLLSIILLINCLPDAQSKDTLRVRRNEVGLELGGVGLIYNVYYQKRILTIDNKILGLKIGAGIYPATNESAKGKERFPVYNFNITPNIQFVDRKHAWELGLGLSYFDLSRYNVRLTNYLGQEYVNDEIVRMLLLVPQLSYRYYFEQKRFYIKPSLMIHARVKTWDGYSELSGPKILPWVGFSFGFTF